MKRLLFVIGIIVTALSLSAAADIFAKTYVWTDKNGIKRQTSYRPSPEQLQQTGSKKVKAPQVELYVTSWCPYCKKAKEYFASRNIAVKIYDIEKDQQAAARKNKLAQRGSGVPFAIVNGYKIYGFNPEGYDQALKKK